MTESRFSLDITWDSDVPEGTAFSATAGRAILRVGATAVWGKSANVTTKGVHWTWVDLLTFLAENWIDLLTEPTPLSFEPAPAPHLLRHQAEQRWNAIKYTNEDQYLEEEDALFYFEERHDLSRAITGKVIPNCFIVRDGSEFAISSNAGALEYIPFLEVLESLEHIGNAIAQRLEGIADPVAAVRRTQWANRYPPMSTDQTSRWSNTTPSYLQEISGCDAPATFWSDGKSRFQEALPMVLARMGAQARLSANSVKIILDEANTARRALSHQLQDLQQRAALQLIHDRTPAPADQGRGLASWYRREILNVPASLNNLDPLTLINSLGTHFQTVVLPELDVDAITCWRPGKQPTVLLNTESTRNRRSSGQRTALAHELCHLIADYSVSVPFSDVIKGIPKGRHEKRARGFAAELLMPTERAVTVSINGMKSRGEVRGLSEAINQLSEEFDVSTEVTAWQLRRSYIYKDLSPEGRAVMRRFVSCLSG